MNREILFRLILILVCLGTAAGIVAGIALTVAR